VPKKPAEQTRPDFPLFYSAGPGLRPSRGLILSWNYATTSQKAPAGCSIAPCSLYYSRDNVPTFTGGATNAQRPRHRRLLRGPA